MKPLLIRSQKAYINNDIQKCLKAKFKLENQKNVYNFPFCDAHTDQPDHVKQIKVADDFDFISIININADSLYLNEADEEFPFYEYYTNLKDRLISVSTVDNTSQKIYPSSYITLNVDSRLKDDFYFINYESIIYHYALIAKAMILRSFVQRNNRSQQVIEKYRKTLESYEENIAMYSRRIESLIKKETSKTEEYQSAI